MYTTGNQVQTALRLGSIQVMEGSQLVRSYVLNYGFSTATSRSLLSSVTQYGSDGETALPPTTFVYQQGANGFGAAQSWGSGFTNTVMPGDFNGDGRTDMLNVASSGQVDVAPSNGTSLGGFTPWGSIPPVSVSGFRGG